MMTKSTASRLPEVFSSCRGTLVSCIFVTLFVLLVTWPLLDRSPWVDEVSLFLNYPISPFQAFFSPLPYHNQAATPLYSVVWSLLGFLRPFYIRLLSLSTLLFLSICLVSYSIDRRALSAACVAAASILAYWPSFMMLSEMKHYGLEILACLCIVIWVVRKDPNEQLNQLDLLILVASLLLGISTFPLGAIALAIFFAHRFWKVGGIVKSECVLSAVYLAAASAYYLLVKKVVFFQVSNYPDAYRYEGIIISVKQYLSALAGLLPGGGLNAVVLFVLIPFFIVFLRSLADDSSRRLLAFAVLTFLVYLALSALGVYPAKYSRHVIWFSAVLWVIFGTALSFVMDCIRQYSRRSLLAYIPLIAVFVVSFAPFVRSASMATSDMSGTHNNEAISQLKEMPASKVRFWIGGESVFHYYLRHDPGLSKFSVRDWTPRPSALVEYENPDTYDRTKIDMLPPARDAFSDVRPGERFLIFASHFDRQGGWAPNRSKGLHDALAERMCKFSTKDFQNVSIYDVICKS
jgi:hypothetical protein